jgi:hypothetical protein
VPLTPPLLAPPPGAAPPELAPPLGPDPPPELMTPLVPPVPIAPLDPPIDPPPFSPSPLGGAELLQPMANADAAKHTVIATNGLLGGRFLAIDVLTMPGSLHLDLLEPVGSMAVGRDRRTRLRE